MIVEKIDTIKNSLDEISKRENDSINKNIKKIFYYSFVAYFNFLLVDNLEYSMTLSIADINMIIDKFTEILGYKFNETGTTQRDIIINKFELFYEIILTRSINMLKQIKDYMQSNKTTQYFDITTMYDNFMDFQMMLYLYRIAKDKL